MRLVAAVLLVACCALAHTRDEIIEPHLRMVDRSPSAEVHPQRFPAHTQGFEEIDPNFDEGISFSVNTRGELGPSRAPLFCNCRVLTALLDDENPVSKSSRRSYTAPELRQHVPLVTTEYAEKNEQISFGVNVRGEEGNEFNPTWCTCHVLPHQRSTTPHPTEADESDEEEPQPASRVRRSPDIARPGFVRPHHVADNVNLQTAEGSATIPSPAQMASETVNLQLAAGSELKSTTTHQHKRHHNSEISVPSQAMATEFYYRGRHFSADGKHIPTVAASAQVLTQLDEGTNDTVAETPTAADVPSEVPPTTVEVVSESMSASPSPLPSLAPSASAELSSTIAAPQPSPEPSTSSSADDDDNSDDPVIVLSHLAHKHPHAAALLAKAMQTAEMQQKEELQKLQAALESRDMAIRQLVEQNHKTEVALEDFERQNKLLMMTASPSTTPSPSPSISLSSSSSVSRSPTPSPSPSMSMEPEPIIEVPAVMIPRPDKKLCYRKCRDSECAPLFEQSLRRYADCMDECASRCYGSH